MKAPDEFRGIDKNIEREQQRFFIFTHRLGFRRDIGGLREKWHIPVEGIRDDQKLQRWREQHFTPQFYKDIDSIITKYKIPTKWRQAVSRYVYTNEPKYAGPIGPRVQVSVSLNDYDYDEVQVVLDAHTTRQDLIDSWPDIKYYLDQIKSKEHDKFQPINEYVFYRGQLAYELQDQGLTYDEIRQKLDQKYNKGFSNEEVMSFIKNHKQLLGIN